MLFRLSAVALAIGLGFTASAHAAGPELVAIGSLTDLIDKSGLTGTLENGNSAAILGGIGSGLAWAGGNTFLALPDRGPNATAWISGTDGTGVDNTTSYISRFQTLTLNLSTTASGGLPYTLNASLNSTTLLSSATALNYGTAPTTITNGVNYFTGRSDAFAAGSTSASINNARLDPEALRVSADGKSVYVSDEYGPYVYQFDRATGVRTNSYALPAGYYVANLNSVGATEIANNKSQGRVANKGMEGLAITPNGQTLVGFMQSPLAQDGGDGGRLNRIVTIDTQTGATKQYAYDNYLTDKSKTYNSSEILALNSHEFLVLERDGSGLGNGNSAAVKRIYKVDLAGATDISDKGQGEATLLPYAVNKTLFLDLRAEMNAKGITDANIPAKLEGMAFGEDVVENGKTWHTLYVGNDNDFTNAAGANKIFVFRFDDSALGGSVLVNQSIAAVPEPGTWALMLGGIAGLGAFRRRSARR